VSLIILSLDYSWKGKGGPLIGMWLLDNVLQAFLGLPLSLFVTMKVL